MRVLVVRSPSTLLRQNFLPRHRSKQGNKFTSITVPSGVSSLWLHMASSRWKTMVTLFVSFLAINSYDFFPPALLNLLWWHCSWYLWSHYPSKRWEQPTPIQTGAGYWMVNCAGAGAKKETDLRMSHPAGRSLHSGESGIRTRGTRRFYDLASRRLKPLGQLSYLGIY